MTDKELRMGYIGWSPDFREYKDIKARKTVVGRVVTKQEWEAALKDAYRRGVEAIMNQARSHASIDRRMVSLPFLEGVASRLVDEKP